MRVRKERHPDTKKFVTRVRFKTYAHGNTPWVGDIHRPGHGVEVMRSYPDPNVPLVPVGTLERAFKPKQARSRPRPCSWHELKPV